MEPVEPFLPAPMLQAIGNLAAYWAYLESATEVAMWCFLGVPRDLGAPITTHMSLVSRCHALKILASRRFVNQTKVGEMFEELLGRIDKARIKRNTVIHALWGHTKEGTEAPVIKIVARGVFKEEISTYSLKQINAITDEICDITDNLQGCLEAVFTDAHLPWPREDDEESPPA